MSPEEIKEIVKLTVDELARNKLLKADYQNVLRVVNEKLYAYFDNKCDGVCHILRQLADDPYIDIIYLHYRDKETMERIAEYYDRDITTIKRNKKRLIMHIYRELK